MRFSSIPAYDALCKTLPSSITLELVKGELCSSYQTLNFPAESDKRYKDIIDLLEAFSLCRDLLIYYGADCGGPQVYKPEENQRHLAALHQPCWDFSNSLEKLHIQSTPGSMATKTSKNARDVIEEIQMIVQTLRELTIVPLHSIMIWMAQDALYENREVCLYVRL